MDMWWLDGDEMETTNESGVPGEMTKELYVAAMKGSVEFLEGRSDEYLLLKTRDERNIIHIAVRYEKLDFIEKVLFERFPNNNPNLLGDKESSIGNTPLHIAAEVGNLKVMELLYKYCNRLCVDVLHHDNPLQFKNDKFDTLVHVALTHDNLTVARFLLEMVPVMAYLVNEAGEAPLHVAIQQHVNSGEIGSTIGRIKKAVNKGGAGLSFRSEHKEDMSSVIKFLIEKASAVASWCDVEGSTPLFRAASLDTPYNLQTIRLVIKHCPQSAGVCDRDGKTILHLLVNKIPSYLEACSLFYMNEIYALRNRQDFNGNTPLHIAAQSMDSIMLRILIETSANLYINNHHGKTALSFIPQHYVFEMMRQRKMTCEESKAADEGNVTFLWRGMERMGLDFALSKDLEGKNFLHKLMQLKNGRNIMVEGFLGFIKDILEFFSTILSQTDENENTPLHILVMQNNYHTKFNTDAIINYNSSLKTTFNQSWLSLELLQIFDECINENRYQNELDHYSKPWLVRNADGNTPLHEAVIAKNKDLVLKMLEYDSVAASMINNQKQTPLHLLAQSKDDQKVQFLREDIEKILETKREAARYLDEEGLTPMLRAIKEGNVFTAAMLCDIYPEAAVISDRDGNTIWHLLIKHPSSYFVYRLLKNKALRPVLKQANIQGDTPLHLAIQYKRFDLVHEFFLASKRERNESRAKNHHQSPLHSWLMILLGIPNAAGKSPFDFIQDLPELPENVEEIILRDDGMRGIRSAWNIPTSQLNNSMNSMNVIAALLTTITFTAAFTVPGGLIQDVGFPILIRSKAFQVFLIADVVAMCLSMMVLICLLWIMATSNKRDSVMIQDFTVALLLAAFVATLLTFMAGVYATIFPVKRWIAIITVILCSLTGLLVVRKILTCFLLPIRNATINFYRLTLQKVGNRVSKFIPRKMIREDSESGSMYWDYSINGYGR